MSALITKINYVMKGALIIMQKSNVSPVYPVKFETIVLNSRGLWQTHMNVSRIFHSRNVLEISLQQFIV